MVFPLFNDHHFQRHAILRDNQQFLEFHTSNPGSLLIQISKHKAENIGASIGLAITWKERILILTPFP